MLKRRVSLRVNFYHDEPPSAPGSCAKPRRSASSTIPAIRHVYDAGVDRRSRLPGRQLDRRRGAAARRCSGARGRFPTVLALARDLLSALEHAHLHGIIVRRIVADLGAGERERPRRRSPTSASAATPCPPSRRARRPTMPMFMAPGGPRRRARRSGLRRLHRGRAALLRGHRPGAAARPAAAPAAHRAPARPARGRSSGSSCGRCSPAPDDRYLTAAEMLEDLASDAGTFETRPSASGQGPLTGTRRRARWEKRLRRALGDDYELLALLGTGGFGRVYRVRDLHLEREVALKVLHPAAHAGPRGGRAVPARGPARRRAQPPEHRQHLRHRRGGRASSGTRWS